MGIISELMPGRLLEECDLAEEEPERVEPGQEHPRDNLSHAFFSEAKIVATDYRRVDEEHPTDSNIVRHIDQRNIGKEQPRGISTVPVKDQGGIGVIL